MTILHFFYKWVYRLSLLFVFVLIPFTMSAILFYNVPKKDYQVYLQGKMFNFLYLIAIGAIFSLILYILRKEKTPSRWFQWFLIAGLFMAIVTFFSYGTILTKNYSIQALDGIPIHHKGKLTNVYAYQDKYFSAHDLSKHGQIPLNAIGLPYRYVIEFTIDDQQTYRTASLFYEGQYKQLKKKFENMQGQKLIVTTLPDSNRLVSVESVQLPGNLIYQDPFFLENLGEE